MRVIHREFRPGEYLISSRLMNDSLCRILGIRRIGYRKIIGGKSRCPGTVFFSKPENIGQIIRKNDILQALIFVVVSLNNKMEIRFLFLIIIKGFHFFS